MLVLIKDDVGGSTARHGTRERLGKVEGRDRAPPLEPVQERERQAIVQISPDGVKSQPHHATLHTRLEPRSRNRVLGRCFRDVCAQAGMEGELQLAPSSIEGESALDVRIAHQPSEPKRSYKSGKHSGGEEAKISLLLLRRRCPSKAPPTC
ncbi:MAG: hypothetical protein ACRDNC_11580 [Gaiellaceae bacterium]